MGPGVSALELCCRVAGQQRTVHPGGVRLLCVGRAGLRVWPGGPLFWADVPGGPAAKGQPCKEPLFFVPGPGCRHAGGGGGHRPPARGLRSGVTTRNQKAPAVPKKTAGALLCLERGA